MNFSLHPFLRILALGALFASVAAVAPGQEPPPDAAPSAPSSPDVSPAEPAEEQASPAATEDPPLRRLDTPAAAETVDEPVEAEDTGMTVAPEPPTAPAPPHSTNHQREIVRIGGDALLAAGESAGEVVAVGGNVVVDGYAHRAVVAVFGDNTINGSAHEAVAVMGSVTVNGHVRGEVVAVLGNVQLGPNAVVDGEIVCVGGEINRAPGAVVHGPVQQVGPFPFVADGADALRTWFQKCLFLGRPLAFDPRLMWFWGAAFAFLGVYLLLALVFNRGMIACAETLEQRPGMTLVVSILTALLAPVLTVLLSFIGVGLLLVPLMFLAGLFGKAAFLAWMGRRILQPLGVQHTFPAVLVGGLILLLLYTIPFAGFILMTLTNMIGLGMVVYAVIGATQRPTALPPGGPTTAAPLASPPPVAPGTGMPAGAMAAAAPMGAVAAPPPIPHNGMAAAAAGVDPGPAEVRPVPPELPRPVVPPAPSFSAAPPPMPAVPPPVLTPTQLSTLPRAGFWIRLAASVLDAVLVAVVVNLIGLEQFFPLFFAAYCVALWALRGTTIGGVICGLKVVRLDDRRLDWTIALVRALGGFLSLTVIGLGFVWVLFDDERQSWHDKIAGTTIVRVPKGVSLI